MPISLTPAQRPLNRVIMGERENCRRKFVAKRYETAAGKGRERYREVVSLGNAASQSRLIVIPATRLNDNVRLARLQLRMFD